MVPMCYIVEWGTIVVRMTNWHIYLNFFPSQKSAKIDESEVYIFHSKPIPDPLLSVRRIYHCSRNTVQHRPYFPCLLGLRHLPLIELDLSEAIISVCCRNNEKLIRHVVTTAEKTISRWKDNCQNTSQLMARA